jgi:basic membrane lipoprotein Med (substrate-binding protein (PBP1-ABC) superfamily)
VVVLVAACGSSSSSSSNSGGSSTGSSSSTGSGPPQGPVKQVAAFGVLSPETSPFDKGGFDGLHQAASILGATPVWLSNISFDQSPQAIQRLARGGTNVIISNGSGFAQAMLAAAQQYPKTWFWVYADLASTKGLPNVVGIRLDWTQMGYMSGAFACMASHTKKVGLVIAEPIPAYQRAAGGSVDGVKAGCGSASDLLTAWTGTFSDNATTKQAAEALIAKGADVVFDFQDAGTVGVQSAVREHPNVKYVSAESDATKNLPKQIVVSIVPQYPVGYAAAAKLMASKQLQPKVYLSSVATGAFLLTPFTNVPASVAKQGDALFKGLKAGTTTVNENHLVSK